MDVGFEGGFKVPKATINTDIHKDWIQKEDDAYYYLKETFLKQNLQMILANMPKFCGMITFQKSVVMT